MVNVRILPIIVVAHKTRFKRGFLKIYVFDKIFQNIWKSRRIRRKITESFSVQKKYSTFSYSDILGILFYFIYFLRKSYHLS